MKYILGLYFLVAQLPAFATTEISCTPTIKTSTSESGSISEKLSPIQAQQNALQIEKSGNSYKVSTRNNTPVLKELSGIYTIYYGSNITIKIESSSDKYFEFVNMGLSTITYFGKCL